jgi:hypothetical protein
LTAKAKDYSLNFISDKKQVFEELNQAEILTKRIFRLEEMFLNDDEMKKTLFKDSGEFYSSQTFYSMSSKYKIHLLCYLFDQHKNKLTKQQISDVKRFLKAKESLLLLSEKASSDDIFQALKPIFKKSMTKTKAVRLARILFETSRTKEGDYLLKSEKNLESYLKELNLDSKRILTDISSFATTEKQETSQSKIIIQESNTLQYAY